MPLFSKSMQVAIVLVGIQELVVCGCCGQRCCPFGFDLLVDQIQKLILALLPWYPEEKQDIFI